MMLKDNSLKEKIKNSSIPRKRANYNNKKDVEGRIIPTSSCGRFSISTIFIAKYYMVLIHIFKTIYNVCQQYFWCNKLAL